MNPNRERKSDRPRLRPAESGEPSMTTSARHVLNVAILRHEAKTGERLPLRGWEHYATTLGDDGLGRFHYDRAPEDGHGWLVVVTGGDDAARIDWRESHVTEEALGCPS
jgi:hypothetical protein